VKQRARTPRWRRRPLRTSSGRLDANGPRSGRRSVSQGFQVPVEEARQESPLLRERAPPGPQAVERAREESDLKGTPERRVGSLCLWVEDTKSLKP
jgi:hypothetical protein